MEYKRFGDKYLLRLQRGEEVVAALTALAEKENITLAAVQGLGAADEVTLGVYNVSEKLYHKNSFSGAFEITSLTGTLDTMDGKPYLHLHMNIGNEQGQVFGGHLNSCRISVTAEIVISLIPGQIDRQKDPEIGINLWKLHGAAL